MTLRYSRNASERATGGKSNLGKYGKIEVGGHTLLVYYLEN